MSKPRVDPTFGISSVDVLILTERHPACRWREAQLGSCKERENLAGDAKGKGPSGPNRKTKVPMHRRGADCSVRIVRLDARKDEVWNGSWLCQNGLGVVGPDSKDPGISQATIAAISGPTPTMFMTRVRL
jgi:hypothetical protein